MTKKPTGRPTGRPPKKPKPVSQAQALKESLRPWLDEILSAIAERGMSETELCIRANVNRSILAKWKDSSLSNLPTLATYWLLRRHAFGEETEAEHLAGTDRLGSQTRRVPVLEYESLLQAREELAAARQMARDIQAKARERERELQTLRGGESVSAPPEQRPVGRPKGSRLRWQRRADGTPGETPGETVSPSEAAASESSDESDSSESPMTELSG
jgi:hypothetical protein